MRLEGTEPSKNFKDISWIPEPDRLINFLTGLFDRKRKLQGHQRADDSYVNNPYADMNLDEQSMARSGASYEQLLFLRALQEQNKRGYSPYIHKRK